MSVVVVAVAGIMIGFAAMDDGAGNHVDGAATADRADSHGPAAPPISLGGPAGSVQSAGAAVDDGLTVYASAYGFGQYAFASSGLSADASTATIHRFADRVPAPESAAALAAGLDLDGVPEPQDGGWSVGPVDGPRLSIGGDGQSGFYYHDPLIDPFSCPGDDGTEVPCEATGELPTERDAIDALRSLVVAAGLDPADFEFTSVTSDGDQAMARSAQAWMLVDGTRTDQAWSLQLTFDGIIRAWGALAPIVPVGEVGIVSEQEGFERLADPRFGPVRREVPPAAPVTAYAGPESWMPRTEPPAVPEPGAAIEWPVDEVEIVDARPALATHSLVDGALTLIPEYEFTDSDGGVWAVIAVEEAELRFVQATME